MLPFAAISAILLTGCVTQPPLPRTTQIQCIVPKIDVIADKVNQQTQSKGGLDITIVPALYQAVRADKTKATQVDPGFFEIAKASPEDVKNNKFVELVATPLLKTEPNRVEFVVKIHNQLNRVFHGQGTVVQFNVDGKLIPFNNTDYKEFSGGIVPPLNDSDLKIFGPPLDLLKDKGTISIFLYDVVTATDVAGNTTEKQNYTWDFSYTMQPVTESVEVKTTREWMDPSQYQQMRMEQTQRQRQRVIQNQ